MSSDLERARQLFSDGLARHVEKNWAAAEQLYREALQLIPDRPSIVFNLGRLMLDQDRNAEAEALFRQSLVLVPDHEGSYNLGLALARQQRFGEALAQYDQAIALEPKFAAAHAGRAWALEQLARPAEALDSYARSVELAPDVADFQSGFCRCAAQVGDGFDVGLSPLLETAGLICLMASHGDHQDLRALCTALLARRFTGFRQSLAAINFDLLKAAEKQAQDLQAFCGDWLLMATLEKIVLTDEVNRVFFTRLRASLLRLAVVGPKIPELAILVEPLALFLAQQCYLNRYDWETSADEAAMIEKLEARIAGAIAADAVVGLDLGMLACYVPLHKVPGMAAWGAARMVAAEPALRRLLKQQALEPQLDTLGAGPR